MIGERLSRRLVLEATPPVAAVVFNAASDRLASLQVVDLPAVGYMWGGWTPEAPPEEGPHIRSHGPMTFLVMVFAASGTDPTDPGPAHDVMEAVEDALVDFEVRWSETDGATLYLMEQRPEGVDGVTVILSAVFGMDVVKVATG